MLPSMASQRVGHDSATEQQRINFIFFPFEEPIVQHVVTCPSPHHCPTFTPRGLRLSVGSVFCPQGLLCPLVVFYV